MSNVNNPLHNNANANLNESITNQIDITSGNPINDPRVIQYERVINQLKHKIELQAESNRQLECDKNKLMSELHSYKQRCNDLQNNLDYKDIHLNEVIASLTLQFSQPNVITKQSIDFGSTKVSDMTLHISLDTDTNNTYSLIDVSRNEMTLKVQNASKNKLHNYIYDLFDKYNILFNQKNKLFQDLIKATLNKTSFEKQCFNKDKEISNYIQKVKTTNNHLKTLQKSLNKERKKNEKYHVSFEAFKSNAIKKRKELKHLHETQLINNQKLENVISKKDELIQKNCNKLKLYQERLAQFEGPIFKQRLTLISCHRQRIQKKVAEKLNENDFDEIRKNLSHFVEIKLVKHFVTSKLYFVITKDGIEIFRGDFSTCLNIEKNEIDEDFSIHFKDDISFGFRADSYLKTRRILIHLRELLDKHCDSKKITGESRKIPEQSVTSQMNMFFGGGD